MTSLKLSFGFWFFSFALLRHMIGLGQEQRRQNRIKVRVQDHHFAFSNEHELKRQGTVRTRAIDWITQLSPKMKRSKCLAWFICWMQTKWLHGHQPRLQTTWTDVDCKRVRWLCNQRISKPFMKHSNEIWIHYWANGWWYDEVYGSCTCQTDFKIEIDRWWIKK